MTAKPNYLLEVIGLMFIVLSIPVIVTYLVYPDNDISIKLTVFILFFAVELIILKINEDINILLSNNKS